MKKAMLITLVIFAVASLRQAQIGAAPATDVLGAHLNYGRGCPACHAPHSGAYGNGAAKTADPNAGNIALWGQDVRAWSAKPLSFGGGRLFGNPARTQHYHPGPQHHPMPELP